MAGVKDISNVWKNIREVDLRPIREEALNNVRVAIAGAPGSGRHTLLAQMRSDPARPDLQTQTPVMITDLNTAGQTASAELIILMVDPLAGPFERQRELAKTWSSDGKQVLIFVNKLDILPHGQEMNELMDWPASRMIFASANNSGSLLGEFVPAVMELLPDRMLAMARQFPLFRLPVANHLINETCFSNATYALSTGLAETVPVLDIPLNVADMFVLTKAQAFLVYRLGLALGFSTRWQDYLSEFGSVIGSGFLWRQLARQLVGLIPVWGIVPKVAVAYSGTYVVGHAVLEWYKTGRHITPRQMRELYRRAFAFGRGFAINLLERRPRPRLLRLPRRKPKELPARVIDQNAEQARICPNCGRSNSPDANYCQACGQPLAAPEIMVEDEAGTGPAAFEREAGSAGEPGGASPGENPRAAFADQDGDPVDEW